jgi:hypothetical protein
VIGNGRERVYLAAPDERVYMRVSPWNEMVIHLSNGSAIIGAVTSDIPSYCLSARPEFPIVLAMGIFVGCLLLLIAALGLRQLLGLSSKRGSGASRPDHLTDQQLAIFTPFSTEVETQVVIISIALNDAITEHNSGHADLAWRLVQLSASEWARVAETITGLMDALHEYLPQACGVIPCRGMGVRRFKSRLMTDHHRMYEFLDRVIVRSRMRFQLQIHASKRAVAALTTEFNRTYHSGERTGDLSPEFWQRLDFCSHDFDLLTKETLLAFRGLLTCLPAEDLAAFAVDLEGVLRRGVLSAPAAA